MCTPMLHNPIQLRDHLHDLFDDNMAAGVKILDEFISIFLKYVNQTGRNVKSKMKL